MTCLTASNTLKIIKGEEKEFTITILTETGDPFDLTGVDNVKVILLKNDKSKLIKDLTNGVSIFLAIAGKIKVKLEEVDTQELLAGENQDIEVEIIKNANQTTMIVQLKSVLNVYKRLGE